MWKLAVKKLGGGSWCKNIVKMVFKQTRGGGRGLRSKFLGEGVELEVFTLFKYSRADV